MTITFHSLKSPLHNCKRLTCADGFSVSVQGHPGAYCSPERETPGVPRTHVELGYPSEADPLLNEWCEDRERPTDTVYGHVPAEVVAALITKHGGLVTPSTEVVFHP